MIALCFQGCSACSTSGGEGPDGGDAGDADGEDADRDIDDDADGDHDVVEDSGVPLDASDEPRLDADRPDVADAEADHDDALPTPYPMDLVEIPRDREGLDCGPGCRQVTFAYPLTTFWSTCYDVSDRYVVYKGGYRLDGPDDIRVFLVDLETGAEFQILDCAGRSCSTPTVDGETVVLATRPVTSAFDWTIWTYQLGDAAMSPLIRRWVTEYGRPVKYMSLDGGTLTWYDSSIPPAGIYAMPAEGGEVTDLTDARCVCYLFPRILGRQVLYEGFQTYWHNIWIVDLDTLEHRNLTNASFDQFFPAWDGNWVAWADSRNDGSIDPFAEPTNSDIYGMELPSAPERPICTHPAIQLHPAVGAGIVVWEDYRNAANPNDFRAANPNIDLYQLNLETMEESQLTSLPGPETLPRIHGRRVFFIAPDLIGQDSLFMIDLDEAAP